MQPPSELPAAVLASLERYAKQHNISFETLKAEVKWDSLNGNYYFNRHGMYHGVEVDGNIHT